jgi:hypothetical protein
LESIIQSTEYVEKFSVKIVSGAGHFPHQEKPELVNEAIIKFLVGKLDLKMMAFLLFDLYNRMNGKIIG